VIEQDPAATAFKAQIDASKAQRFLDRIVPVRRSEECKESAATGA
jgi:hypothetical protein